MKVVDALTPAEREALRAAIARYTIPAYGPPHNAYTGPRRRGWRAWLGRWVWPHQRGR